MESITNQRQAIHWVLAQTDPSSPEVEARFESPYLAVEVSIDENEGAVYRFLRPWSQPSNQRISA